MAENDDKPPDIRPSLLDCFAVAAMEAMLIRRDEPVNFSALASEAYDMAYEMVECSRHRQPERFKTKP